MSLDNQLPLSCLLRLLLEENKWHVFLRPDALPLTHLTVLLITDTWVLLSWQWRCTYDRFIEVHIQLFAVTTVSLVTICWSYLFSLNCGWPCNWQQLSRTLLIALGVINQFYYSLLQRTSRHPHAEGDQCLCRVHSANIGIHSACFGDVSSVQQHSNMAMPLTEKKIVELITVVS